MGKPMNPDKVTRITDEVGRLLDLQTEMIKPFRDDGSNLGIGLACLKERVRELGGRVDIDSDTGGHEDNWDNSAAHSNRGRKLTGRRALIFHMGDPRDLGGGAVKRRADRESRFPSAGVLQPLPPHS